MRNEQRDEKKTGVRVPRSEEEACRKTRGKSLLKMKMRRKTCAKNEKKGLKRKKERRKEDGSFRKMKNYVKNVHGKGMRDKKKCAKRK